MRPTEKNPDQYANHGKKIRIEIRPQKIQIRFPKKKTNADPDPTPKKSGSDLFSQYLMLKIVKISTHI